MGPVYLCAKRVRILWYKVMCAAHEYELLWPLPNILLACAIILEHRASLLRRGTDGQGLVVVGGDLVVVIGGGGHGHHGHRHQRLDRRQAPATIGHQG